MMGPQEERPVGREVLLACLLCDITILQAAMRREYLSLRRWEKSWRSVT